MRFRKALTPATLALMSLKAERNVQSAKYHRSRISPVVLNTNSESRHLKKTGAPNDNFRKIICSEDDLRSRIFGSVSDKFLACLPLLGFSKFKKIAELSIFNGFLP